MSPLERDIARGPHVNLQAKTDALTDLIHHPPLLVTAIKPMSSIITSFIGLSNISPYLIHNHTLDPTRRNKLHT